MGVVYLASDPVLNRQVAMKTVDLSVEEPQEREFLRERLFRDARAAAVLKHPNIVAIYDVFEDAGRAYVVMEYIEGDSLAARLKTNPMPDASAMLKVLTQMADALDYTHARGVIHRDIKPANVMIDTTGTTKIMDFGIARISDTRTCTPTGMVMGTVDYMAPEQILGETVDGRADQFSLAVVAYQMMTGTTLYGPNTVATLTYKLVNEAPAPPSTRNAYLPRGVDVVLAKGLSKKPADRFATCREFALALATAFSDAPTAPIPTPTAQVSPLRTETTLAMPAGASVAVPVAVPDAGPESAGGSRTPVIAAALAVVLLAGALAAVIWKPWTRLSEPPVTTTAAVAPPTSPASAVKTPAKPPSTETAASTTPVPAPIAPEPKKEEPLKAESAKPEPPKPEPVKIEPAKPEPPRPNPSATVATPAQSLPDKSVGSIPPPVAAEPAGEMDFGTISREPKMKSGPPPYLQAMQRGQMQVKSNDYVGALRSFGDAVTQNPQSAQARYSRGFVFQHLEQLDAAMRDYMDALRLDPNMAVAYVQLGSCLVIERRDPQALVYFQRALELKPDAVLALFGRGNIYLRRREFNAAIADYNRLLTVNPRYAPAYQNRAVARQAMGDFAGAAADRRTEQSLRR